QAQIRESTLPLFFEQKPRGRKLVPVPTTEGVTVNEQVTTFQNPLARPGNRPNPPPVQQQQQPRPVLAQCQYNAIPPPNGVKRIGPKRQSYPPLPETLEDIFTALMFHNAIQLPPRKEVWSPWLDHTKYCLYLRSPGHLISNCFTFRDWV